MVRAINRDVGMKCVICGNEIRGRYLVDVWQQPMCAGHNIEYCSSCGRFVKPGDLHLPDGRCLCSYCVPTIVRTQQHIEWVEQRVRPMLAKNGIGDLPASIPIKLVSPAEIARLNGSAQVNLNQQGLTKSSKSMSILGTKCSHTIYMQDNLPRIRFAGVLAHEMLHVWMNEKGITLQPMLTEGFCNVGSYIVFKAIDNDLSLHMIKLLEQDRDPVYGDGFRKVVEFYRKNNSLTQVMMQLKRL